MVCPYRFNDKTRDKLMMEVAGEDFESKPLPSRIILDDLEQVVSGRGARHLEPAGFALLEQQLTPRVPTARDAWRSLRRFCHIEPRSRTRREDLPTGAPALESRRRWIAGRSSNDSRLSADKTS